MIVWVSLRRGSASANNDTDPGNDQLWRQNLHRLEAEVIRDWGDSSSRLHYAIKGRGSKTHWGGACRVDPLDSRVIGLYGLRGASQYTLTRPAGMKVARVGLTATLANGLLVNTHFVGGSLLFDEF